MGKLNLGLQRNKEGKIIRSDGEGGTKVIKAGGGVPRKYTPGRYIAKVLNVSVKSSAKSRGTVNFSVDTEVVEVLEQELIDPKTKMRTKLPTAVGQRAGVLTSSKSLSYTDEVVINGLACLGHTVDTLPADEDPEALVDEITIDMDTPEGRNAKSPAAGTHVLVEAWEGRYGDKSTKGTSGELSGFVNTRLFPLPDALKEKYPDAAE